jgi:hypothetical protein
MPKINAAIGALVFAIWCLVHPVMARAEPAPFSTSTETVEALLQAENKSILQRANVSTQHGVVQTATNTQPAPVNRELALLSVYGVLSDLRIDVKYGDFIYAGLAKGQRMGPLEVVSIDGTCVQLLMLQEDHRPVRYCWSLTAASREPAPVPAARPEPLKNAPLPPGMNLPSLPGVSGLLGLIPSATPTAPLPAVSK